MPASQLLDRSQRAERAKALRREEILDAARRVFAERGFRGTTIADIAEAAGIALGTVYLYFPSKEDVFAALNHRLGELISAGMVDVQPGARLDEMVRRSVGNVFEACGGNRDLVRLVVLNTDPGSAATMRMRDADQDRARPLTEALRAGMAAGGVRAGDPCIMANLIRGLVSIAVYQAFVLSDGKHAAAYRDACAEMVLAYVTPPRQEQQQA